MYRLLEFIRNTYTLLLFIILELGAIWFYTNSNSYTQAKMLSYTSTISGSMGQLFGSVGEYFRLRRENESLTLRILALEEELSFYGDRHKDSLLRQLGRNNELRVNCHTANVISTTLNRDKNFIILDRGVIDGIRKGMAVVTPQREAVGVVMEANDHRSIVMSLLNVDFRTSGEIEGAGGYAGAITWGGRDRYRVEMKELSKYTPIEIGSKVITTGFSRIFPAGVTIGRVAHFGLNTDQTSYQADIDLSCDMSSLRTVLIIDAKTMSSTEEFDELLITEI